ncbi:MAG TPA: hypothetical protein VNN74_06885 [Candidatus Micrarchaeia archaeon]|nr:hypothetical protein [Candidatus Micrarchaeia archaeon]
MDWATAQSIANDPAAVQALAGATIYEIVQPGGRPAPGLPAIATLDFKSVATMSASLSAGQASPWDEAVVYDPEHWAATPLSEQQSVVAATAQAATLAAAHHLTLIATPASDLMEVLMPGQWPLYQDYLTYDLAGKTAALAPGLIDIQAQASETSLPQYVAQITGATAQSRGANPSTTVLGDITDHLNGAAVPINQITAAINATDGVVQGYFLNAPTAGGAIIQALG